MFFNFLSLQTLFWCALGGLILGGIVVISYWIRRCRYVFNPRLGCTDFPPCEFSKIWIWKFLLKYALAKARPENSSIQLVRRKWPVPGFRSVSLHFVFVKKCQIEEGTILIPSTRDAPRKAETTWTGQRPQRIHVGIFTSPCGKTGLFGWLFQCSAK